MGTDLKAIIGYRDMFPPTADLPARMNADPRLNQRFSPNHWNYPREGKVEEGAVFLQGDVDAGYHLWISANAIVITTGLEWTTLAGDVEQRKRVFSAITALGVFFGSPNAVILPDDVEPWFTFAESVASRGVSLEELLESMARVRPPCATMAEAIAEGDGADIDGYLVLSIS